MIIRFIETFTLIFRYENIQIHLCLVGNARNELVLSKCNIRVCVVVKNSPILGQNLRRCHHRRRQCVAEFLLPDRPSQHLEGDQFLSAIQRKTTMRSFRQLAQANFADGVADLPYLISVEEECWHRTNTLCGRCILAFVDIDLQENCPRIFGGQLLEMRCNSLTRAAPYQPRHQ